MIVALTSRQQLPVSVEDLLHAESSSASCTSDVATCDTSPHVTPCDVSSHVTPRDTSPHVTPRDTDSHVTSCDTESNVTPRDVSPHVTPCDTDSHVTLHDSHVSANLVTTATADVTSESVDVNDVSVTLPMTVPAVGTLTSTVDSNQTVSSLVSIQLSGVHLRLEIDDVNV